MNLKDVHNQIHMIQSQKKTKYFKIVGSYRHDVLQLVKNELIKRGYVEAKGPSDPVQLFWSRSFRSHIEHMKPNQKVNWLPAMAEICRKDFLAKNLKRMISDYGREEFLFWPLTFSLPNDKELLANYLTEKGRTPIILKPPLAARCEKIKIITTKEELESLDNWIIENTPIAQEYIMNPYLIDGYKCTFRFYVAITSVDPLRIYLYKDGLVRICTEKFNTEMTSFENIFSHLDSIDLNEVNLKEFDKSITTNITREGLRCDFRELWEEWKKDGKDVDKLWEDIKDIVVKSFLSAEKILSTWVSKLVRKRSNAFEVLGYDILIDQNMIPHLLEINHTPSLAPHTDLENRVKSSMLSELFTLVDIENQYVSVVAEKTDKIMSMLGINQEDKNNFNSTTSPVKNLPPWSLQGKIIPERMSRMDIWTIIDTELEEQREGNFEVCFPNKNSLKYVPFIQINNRTKLLAYWCSNSYNTEEFFNIKEDDYSTSNTTPKEGYIPL
eukprot:TRINITY_DN10574_c0_g1_i1.p1 TRINITY_DN10574_c0_g1~~TRINITY_DN10574_c0_g1_i1.p1  ORF type:complete len:497 (-),score=73.92 TRINITY_DN10574_c0_g1_i1:197-1687(-)